MLGVLGRQAGVRWVQVPSAHGPSRAAVHGVLHPCGVLHDRHRYKHVGDALVQIAKSDGVMGLWKGCSPTVVRVRG